MVLQNGGGAVIQRLMSSTIILINPVKVLKCFELASSFVLVEYMCFMLT